MEEAIYDVLKESRNSNEQGLVPVEICKRMGLPVDGDDYSTTLHILRRMESQGTVESSPIGGRIFRWSLPSD